MAFFKSKKKSSPSDLCKQARDALLLSEKDNPKSQQKASDQMTNVLSQMKYILYGDVDHHPQPEVCQSLADEIHRHDLLLLFVLNIHKFEFEAKKDVSSIFNNLLRSQQGNRSPTVEYVTQRPEILSRLVEGYNNPDIALNCGSMLRECIRHENLCRTILYSDNAFSFFDFVELSNFDVASDAFATFKDLLTKHKTLAAEFLEETYDKVFNRYTSLLNSGNYVTRRQSLKLLGELLLDRANFNVMKRYISDPANLKLMMGLLRDSSRSIQFEAFHVFKVFVANPEKAQPIHDILVRNKNRLETFLSNFHNDNEEEQFNQEKQFLLKQVQQLQA